MSWLVCMQLDKAALERCSFWDSYAWHKAMWKCFPDLPDAERDFLFRMDWRSQGGRIFLLCRSEPVRPDWCLPESWAVKSIAPSFLQHESYVFDLIANPTRTVRRYTDGKQCRNGRRLALLDDESRHEWLISKAKKNGFCLDGEPVVENAGSSMFERRSRTGTHIGARFKGRLTVSDRDLFIHAFYHGVGPAKAFGYGMLLLQPLW